jgi:hypothetical protein
MAITYTSLKQCSQATGIDIQVLKAARNHPNQTGFDSNNRIHWDIAKPFVESHLQELQAVSEDSLLKWKTKKEKANAFLAEIELDEARKLFVKRDEVEAQIKAIALSQRTILKAKLCNECPSRLLGMDVVAMSVEMEKILNEVCGLMNNLQVK